MSQCTYLLEYITTLQKNENDKNEKLSQICLHVHNKQVGWLLEFNVPFQHKYGYIRDE